MTTRVEIGVTETVNILMATGVEQLRCGRPAEAVRTARKVARLIGDPVLRAINVGGFLIDAGADLKRVRLVKEAVDELERVSAQVTEPNRWAYHFNLGNGYSALGHRQKGHGPSTKPSPTLESMYRHSRYLPKLLYVVTCDGFGNRD